MKKLGLIISMYEEDKGQLGKCIRSVIEQEITNEITLHIIVIENGSSTRAKSELYPVLIDFYKTNGQPLPKNFHIRIIDNISMNEFPARDAGDIALRGSVDYIAHINAKDIWAPGFLAQEYTSLCSSHKRAVGETAINARNIFKPVNLIS